ncbi:hypothetical protein LJB92_03845 [Bacteroidales bacterium OttesenSCG-928-M06]|nr:hypothetical protein [Bacteroidales bacterium OttesenSCG-928-M06]
MTSLAFYPLYSQESKRKPEASVDAKEELQPELNVVDNILYIKNAPVGAKLEIISIVGSKVKEIKIKTNDDSFELNLPRAVYIFKLEGVVRKFVIR